MIKKLLFVPIVSLILFSLNGMQRSAEEILPAELQAIILENTGGGNLQSTIHTMCSCRLVCRKWYFILINEEVLKTFLGQTKFVDVREEQKKIIMSFLAYAVSENNPG